MPAAPPALAASIEELRARVGGTVSAPEDAGYDRARRVFFAQFDRRPAAVVRPANESDVSRVVSVARDTGADLAVRGGGHSNAGHGTCDGGIVLDLSGMRALEIDPAGRTAWAQAGLTAGEYTRAAAEHGLATAFGDTGSVGISGLTLGGGVGYLTRKYGMTIDDLLAAEVVTARGEHLHVDAEHHPELFWALRGGGGNFGVVTRFQFRLHPVDTVLGGMLLLPATPDAIASLVEVAGAAPDELSVIAAIAPAPPMPFVPQDHHGRLVLIARLVYAGDVDAGHAVVASLRAIATPIVDLVRPMPYPEMFPPDDPENRPLADVRTMFLDAIDRDTAASMLEHVRASNAQRPAVMFRLLGGAMARVPADATAFGHRTRPIMVVLAAQYATVEERPLHQAWLAMFAAALRGNDPAAYVNFLGDEGEARVREAYPPATWERLVAVKRRYDPDNVFRVNQNIAPGNAVAPAP